MAKIGLFYGGSPQGSTHKTAELIRKALGKSSVDLYNVADVRPHDIEKYNYLILGTSAWGIGDMHRDWEMFIDDLSEIDFHGKKVALFGLGDQKLYPESFVDSSKCKFNSSIAVCSVYFIGLVPVRDISVTIS